MKTSAIIKKLLTGACVYYSVFSLILLTVSVLFKGGIENVGIGVLNVLLLFPFAFALSGAEFVRKNTKISGAARLLLHYLILSAAFLLFLWLPSNMTKNLGNGLMMLLIVTVLYWLIFLICRLTVKRFHSFREE